MSSAQLVTTPTQLSAAINAASPGTTIVLANGTWKDVFINIDGKNGTESQPITITAQKAGEVLMTGNSRVYMEGSYLTVSGLTFQDPENLVVSGGDIEPVFEMNPCNYCKIINNKIDSYNGTEDQKRMKFKWLFLDGQYNEVAYNTFTGKYGIGSYINDNHENNEPDYLSIHHNYFAERTPIDGLNNDNDQDVIRIGVSTTSMSDSYSEVYSNYFYRIFGEIEIISNKSGQNKYYNNTFRDNSGMLTLRHGNDCEVYGNYFFGEDNPSGGGIRVIGERHKVYNNYFEQVNSFKPNGASSNATGGINVTNGRQNSELSGYFQVIDTEIINNTFVDCDYALRIGTNVGGDLSLAPVNLIVENNIMLNTSLNPMQILTAPIGNSSIENNFTELNSTELNDDGMFHRIVSGSSPVDAAIGNYDYLTQDILNGDRDGNVDAGAEEFGANGTHIPFTSFDVGVNVGFGATSSVGTGSGEVIITEYHNQPRLPSMTQIADALADNPGSPSEFPNESYTEWFEIYNTTNAPVVMDGWIISDASDSENSVMIDAFTLEANAYAVFSGFNIPAAQGGLEFDYFYDYGSLSFNNESDYSEPNATTCPDGVMITRGDGSLVDAVSYDYGYGEYLDNPNSSECMDNEMIINLPAQGAPLYTSFMLNVNPAVMNSSANDLAENWSYSTIVYDAVGEQFGTPGIANDGFVPPEMSSGEVIITEYHNQPLIPTQAQLDAALLVNPTVEDTTPNEAHTEWFEIYNTTSITIDMNGWTLTDASDPSQVTTIVNFAIEPFSYAVFSGFRIPAAHGGVEFDYFYSYSSLSFNNEDDYSSNGSTACPDGVIIAKGDGTLVDQVRFDYGYGEYIDNPNAIDCSDFSSPSGIPASGSPVRTSMMLSTDPEVLNSISNDVATNWSYSTIIYDEGGNQFGTPGMPNDGEDLSDTGTGEVIITEIYNRPKKPTQAQLDAALPNNPPGADLVPDEGHTEWFEVYNTTCDPVVMDGWILTDGSNANNVSIINEFTIAPQSYAVFSGFNIPEAQGGIVFDYFYDYEKPGFNNENNYADPGDTACPDGVIITKADGTLVDEVRYDYGYGEYLGNPSAGNSCRDNEEAIGIPPAGSSSKISFMLSVDPSVMNARANDYGFNWSFSTIVYDSAGSQLGTPGLPNDGSMIDNDIDADQDGYIAACDCDDSNPNVNPDQQEIVYNGINDDCNVATLDDDLDRDGYVLADDCDDTNVGINPGAIDIPDNGIDENCDNEDATAIIDLDQDGFSNDVDCDDTDPDINPDAIEIAYNSIDEDCDPLTLDDDLDEDGFLLVDDCDDNNPQINPGVGETPYNGIDDDCDPLTLDDDLDQDGFVFIADCDDTDSAIFPNASCDDGDSCTIDDAYDSDCNCVGHFLDSDQDGICDANDETDGNCELAGACDDGDICTEEDSYDENCNCIGIFQDVDLDGICDAEDDTFGECTIGAACSDGDPCTINDIFDEDCNCSGQIQDMDEDGICDAEDDTNGDCELGASCDDGEICTINDVFDADCNCSGQFQDTDSDGICDAEDDTNGDCELGAICDDGEICTTNDVFDADCNCSGQFQDTDEDGICDAEDMTNGDCELGASCDDGNENTGDGTFDENCNCLDGELIDCLGEVGGDAVVGAPCDDGNICSINDVYTEDCFCLGDPLPQFTYYQDFDNDGFGDPNSTIEFCSEVIPIGYSDNSLDCDDSNPDINPNADEIANNTIDEDCDGMDLISSIHELNGNEINFYPNPVKHLLQVDYTLGSSLELQLYNTSGQLIFQAVGVSTVDCSELREGMYLLKVGDHQSGDFVVERVVVVR